MVSFGAWRSAVVTAAVMLFAAGCSRSAVVRPPAVFFPPAPALPRIQYLTRLSGLRDVEDQSSFNRFVVGEKPDLHLDKPYGVAASGGRIYVCDTNSSVTVFDLGARQFTTMRGASGAGQLRQPVNISIAADGTRYVSDPVRGQVVAFDRSDDYLRAYGEPGSWKPVDAIADGGELFVADMAKARVAVFDVASGALLRSLGDSGPTEGRLARPSNLAIDAEGFLYVTDVGRFQVVKLDRQGRFQQAFGRLGDGPGHFARPKGVAVDRSGVLYAADAAFNNVQVFNAQGRVTMSFGSPGGQEGAMLLPARVAIDYEDVEHFRRYIQPGFAVEYLLLVTSQFDGPRVSVFAYGRQEGVHYPSDEEILQQIGERRAKASGETKAP